MANPVLLITPPFTQLNTPYPATAYLKGFLNTKGIASYQSDLGIEVTLDIFSRKGLERLFADIDRSDELSDNIKRILQLEPFYLQTIDPVVNFLQGHDPTLAHLIGKRNYLPEAGRFAELDDLDWAFGNMGIQDRAKHIATMYLEDLSDLISQTIDPHFGFSRYAEKLARSANSFDELYGAMQQAPGFVDSFLIARLESLITDHTPLLIALSVPFPGNLYSALRCGQYIKQHHPGIRVVMGGGFPNTELRSLSDPRVFEFVDFITLDDGEAPMENLIRYVEGTTGKENLKRCFLLEDGEVTYYNNKSIPDYRQGEVGTPDYRDLWITKYISAIEVLNPMHRMWSDGRWNKLTMAHGCYWGKCTFCDISLDYIRLYEPVAATQIVDRMEEIIGQTGETGFHFVDEAAPPALMRAVAMEIIRRGLVVSWWTNIRFEKSFTRDLCMLLKASGCIAVSGGLEVASDRLLKLIQKGITVEQVARVNRHFTEAGIMVHAYLMYGFPTQTAQETIDSMEMVRQMFEAGILQSAYWHQFAMTAHSPVGLDPAGYHVEKETDAIGTFANNDIVHHDPTGADHDAYTFGLKKSLFNYMHQLGLNDPLQKWFDFKTPRTSIKPDHIRQALEHDVIIHPGHSKIIWLGMPPSVEYFVQSKKGMQREMANISFMSNRESMAVTIPAPAARWLMEILPALHISHPVHMTRDQVRASYEAAELEDFELFWDNKPMNGLYKVGLLSV